MLAKRIIPLLLCRGRKLVKGKGYDAWRSVGVAAQAARIHGARGVDELMLIDLDGPNIELVRELSQDIFIPLTVGGGITSVDQIDKLLRAGADKVLICTGAYTVDGLIEEASGHFGAQAIVGGVEYKTVNDSPCVTIGRGQAGLVMKDTADCLSPLVAAQYLQDLGCGEILLSSIDRDGMMEGYDLDMIAEVSNGLTVPMVACGGCGSRLDMLNAFDVGADACAAGSLFLFTDETPGTAAKYLHGQGMTVRH